MKKVFSVLIILLLVAATALVLVACGGAKPTKLTVLNDPDSLSVIQGGEPDFSGGTVLVEYDNGTSKEVEMSELKVKGLNNATLGKQTVALSYTENGKTVSTAIDLTVVLPRAKSISLNTEKVKTAYVEGEVFDREGLVVTASLINGETAELSVYDISPSTPLTTATKSVKITARGASAEIPVTVSAVAPVSIRFTGSLSKTSYYVGDTFSPTGLVALVTHNNGETETFTSDSLKYYHALGQTEYAMPLSASDNVVRVVANTKYGAISANITLTVQDVAPTRLNVTVLKPQLLTFVEGEYFSFFAEQRAIRVTIVYNSGNEENLIADFDNFTCSSEPLTAGQSSVVIWKEGHPSVTASIPVTVTEPEVNDISVLLSPDKTSYFVGDTVDLTGLVLQLHYSNETYDTLPYYVGCGITPVAAVIAYAQEEVTVEYLGLRASFEIDLIE